MKTMTKKVVRIAIIGCGRVAQHYKKILDSGVVSGWVVVGVCDLIQAKAEYLANHFGCKPYADYVEMMQSENPELILILTPSGLHAAHSRIALELGINVLVEKPIAMIPSEAKELQILAEDKNLMFCVAFQNRFNPAISRLRKALLEQRFGKIVTATIRLRWCRNQDYYQDGWHGTWLMDGGVINQQAIHHVDALNYLLGPIDSVCSAMGNRLNQLEAEDTMVAIVRFSSGALGTIEATTAARPEDYEASLSVVGEKGMVLVGGIALNKIDIWNFVNPQIEDEEVQQKYSIDVPNGYGLSHGTLLQMVVNNLLQGLSTSPVPPIDGIATTELIHALYRSHETGGWVYLEDNPVSTYLGLDYFL